MKSQEVIELVRDGLLEAIKQHFRECPPNDNEATQREMTVSAAFATMVLLLEEDRHEAVQPDCISAMYELLDAIEASAHRFIARRRAEAN